MSFLALLEQAFDANGVKNDELANSAVYLLAIVAPYTSQSLLRAKFSQIMERLVLVLGSSDAGAPLLRSSIGVLETLLTAQDTASWQAPTTQMSPKRAMMGLLALGMDPRPKVRKRAQEAVFKVLKNPPPSPKVEHPAADLCAEIALQSVVNQVEASKKLARKEKATEGENKHPQVIHALQLVRAISGTNQWPANKIEPLCEVLLTITRTSDQYLVIAAFDVFGSVFDSITDAVNSDKLLAILDTIFDLVPSKNDQQLAPSWIAVVAQAVASYARIQPADAFEKLPRVFSIIVGFFESDSKNVHESAAQCLVALVSTAVPIDALRASTPAASDAVLKKLCDTVFGLLHVQFHSSWKEISEVLVALFDVLRWKSDPLMINALKVVGALRSEDSADNRAYNDNVIAAAIRALGPERVLEAVPLNLEPGSSAGRVWLLPLLRENTQHASIGHFTKFFVPLSEKLVSHSAKLKENGDSGPLAMQAKIYDTLNDQIWSLLPRYCDLPTDLRTAFTDEFAQLLANVLYSNVAMRPTVCQALKLVVESNVAYADGAVADDELMVERFPLKEAKKNVKYLADKFASKELSVLFNVFSSTAPEARGYILECINAYLSITKEDEVEATFNKVAKLLHDALESEGDSAEKGQAESQMSLTMMDLVVAMTLYLPASSHNSLLTIFVQLSSRSDRPQLQKRAFRAFSHLAETEAGVATIKSHLDNIEKAFIDVSEKITAPARGARLQALSKVIDLIPDDHLYVIPALLSETVISVKDVNEKTREAAYSLLVQMGNRMKNGGVIQHSKVPNMDADAPDVPATLDEYFTMMSAGLAGVTPHMISATINALARAVFEFRNDMATETLRELSQTVELFLTSNSREIAKSALGFVKICAISLPVEIVEPGLQGLISNLLVWSHEHKGHFTAKVKHIIERLIRRFGYDKIAAVFPEQDAKLLTNIRKSKERAKRKKLAGNDDHDGETSAPKTSKFSNEFDAAVYGSSDDSDGESSDDEDDKKSSRQMAKRGGGDKYILEQGDAPVDLLDRKALAHISSTKPKAKGKQQLAIKEKNKFAKDSSGRLVIKDDDIEIGDDVDLKTGIDAYVQAIKEGPVKGQRNKLKYRRGKKFQASDDDGDSDNEAPRKKDITRKTANAARAKVGKKPFKNPRKKL